MRPKYGIKLEAYITEVGHNEEYGVNMQEHDDVISMRWNVLLLLWNSQLLMNIVAIIIP